MFEKRCYETQPSVTMIFISIKSNKNIQPTQEQINQVRNKQNVTNPSHIRSIFKEPFKFDQCYTCFHLSLIST